MKALCKAKWLLAAVLLLSVVSLAQTVPAKDVSVTLVGEVNDNYQIIAEGQVYEIADTQEGNDLAENHISAKVKVKGTLEERDDLKIIMVTSYQVLVE